MQETRTVLAATDDLAVTVEGTEIPEAGPDIGHPEALFQYMKFLGIAGMKGDGLPPILPLLHPGLPLLPRSDGKGMTGMIAPMVRQPRIHCPVWNCPETSYLMPIF